MIDIIGSYQGWKGWVLGPSNQRPKTTRNSIIGFIAACVNDNHLVVIHVCCCFQETKKTKRTMDGLCAREKPAKIICVVCCEALCDLHTEAHKETRTTEKHTLMPILAFFFFLLKKSFMNQKGTERCTQKATRRSSRLSLMGGKRFKRKRN